MPDCGEAVDLKPQPRVRYQRIMCLVTNGEAVHRIQVQSVDDSSLRARILLDLIEKIRDRKFGGRRRPLFALGASDDDVLSNGQKGKLLVQFLETVDAKTVRV